MMLEYSTDNGSTWSTIVASTSNSNTYSWTVPVIANSSTCKVRVSDVAAASTNSSSAAVFTIMTVNGVASLPNQLQLAAYPSPFTNELIITANSAIKQWRLLDINGKTVLSNTNAGTTVLLSTSTLSNGVYYFQTANQSIKVVKE